MKVSQLLHSMDKCNEVYISDYDSPIDKSLLYRGTVRGITRDNPINKMHVVNICADDDVILVLVEMAKERSKQ